MLDKIIQTLKYFSEKGARFPAAYDADKKAASVTLFFTHIANTVAIIAIALLISKDSLQGTVAAISYAVITMILYMMRRITSFKLDVDDKSIEASNDEGKNENSN